MLYCECVQINDAIEKNDSRAEFNAENPFNGCDENVCKTFDWTWDAQNIQPQTVINYNMVEFHPFYSQGSSVVRSNKHLKRDMIHYWEVKITHWFSGTDLMVGIGTDSVDLQKYRYQFSSVLGLDENSWGYSHRGMIQHRNIFKYYGQSFQKKCIVGVYLDLSRGHLEFYVNRKPQGIAYRNIPLDKKLFAMVCSTSAKSSVQLLNASSIRDSLQFRCMKVISRFQQLFDEVQHIPGLSNLCRSLWYMFPEERYRYNPNQLIGTNTKHDSCSNDLLVYKDGDDGFINRKLFECSDKEVLDGREESQLNQIDSMMDEAIFFSTFLNTEPSTSENYKHDDEPIYCDED